MQLKIYYQLGKAILRVSNIFFYSKNRVDRTDAKLKNKSIKLVHLQKKFKHL